VPAVEQTLDDPQALDLIERIEPVARRISVGLRKTVAPFPDPQRVLADAGVAFDGGNAELQGGIHGAVVHRKDRRLGQSISICISLLVQQ
jgi:hypothetical protein